MATYVLGAIGKALGGPIGGFVGGIVGTFLDRALFGPGDTLGPRISDLSQQAHSPGAPIWVMYGDNVPVGVTIAWTSDLIETAHEEGGIGKGDILSGPTQTTFTYSKNLALLVGEGPASQVKKIEANSRVIYDVAPRVSTTVGNVSFSAIGDGKSVVKTTASVGFVLWVGETFTVANTSSNDGDLTVVGAYSSSRLIVNTSVVTETATNVLLTTQSPQTADVDDIRIALGTQTQQPDAMLEAAEGVGNVTAFRGRVMVYLQNFQLANYGNVNPTFKVTVEKTPYEPGNSAVTVDTVKSVAKDICLRSGLTSSELNVQGLTLEPIRSLAIGANVTYRQALEMVQYAYPFTVVDAGYKLVFRQLNRLADLVIDADDLGAHDADAEDPLVPEPTTRGQERDLPFEINLRFIDPDRNLDVNTVQSQVVTTNSKRTVTVETPLVISAGRAKRSVDDLSVELWLKRTSKRIRVPFKYLAMDAGDVVHIRRAANVLSQRFRVERLTVMANGVIEAMLHPHMWRWARRADPADSGAQYAVGQSVAYDEDSTARLFNLPFLSYSSPDTHGFYAAAQRQRNGNRWRGAAIFRTIDGSTYEPVSTHDFSVVGGSAVTSLPAGATQYPDTKNTLRVRFDPGTEVPSGTTDSALQTNANAAILGADGRWEVLQFRDVAQVSGRVWDLSHLIRGRRGTEYAVSTHAAGDRFYLLVANRIKRVDQDPALDDVSLSYKAVTYGQLTANASATTFTNTNEALVPWSPVQASGVRTGGDLEVVWNRRDRRPYSWYNALPLNETSESWEIDILSGASVVRTVATTNTNLTYSSALQITDFGSVQSTVVIDIFQISSRVGRGHKLRANV